MSSSAQHDYDVVIMGGGPAGATLGALLARQTDLRIAILEKEHFPREHIGESFSHRVIPVLSESGALERVLSSDCWVKKFGGYYAWDPQAPAATFFEHEHYLRDGVLRWAIHCDRAEFDALLLDHAADCGVDVFQGTAVARVEDAEEGHAVITADGRRFGARLFVEASGRQTSVVTRKPKEFLSAYKNVALWMHVVGGKSAQSLEGDWNIFRADDRSAIGCFAFEHGWFWYIPVPKIVDGERVLTHSLGLVTDPAALADLAVPQDDPGRFLQLAREVPLLGDLLEDAKPTRDRLLTATNYSMISDQFCDFDRRWLLIGDSAHFVDPLFSSGVAFALVYAATAALLIRTTFDDSVSDAEKRELWRDFDTDWHAVARSFALAIDQWYHAIAERHPSSVYWKRRADATSRDARDRTFHALVDTDISPDLIHVLGVDLGKGDAQAVEGPLFETRRRFRGEDLGDSEHLRFREDVSLREGKTIEVVRVKSASEAFSDEARRTMERYWKDPVAHADVMPPLYASPRPCHRFCLEDPAVPAIKFRDEIEGGVELFRRLRGRSESFGSLRSNLSERQLVLLNRLCLAGFIETGIADG